MDIFAQSPWWHYLVAVPAAALLINGLPHFLHGIAGERFPTPFSGGPGSSDTAVRNAFWGAANLVAAGVLLWLLSASLGNGIVVAELVLVGCGFAVTMAYLFSHPERFGRGR